MCGVTGIPASVSSLYERWYWHFLEKRDRPCPLPWHDSYLLSIAECRLVARPIQQFQLGEWARGRGLARRASLQGRVLQQRGESSLAAVSWDTTRRKNPEALDFFVVFTDATYHGGLVGDPDAMCANAGHDGSPHFYWQHFWGKDSRQISREKLDE